MAMSGLYRVETVRALERAALAAVPPGLLIRRAAAAVAQAVEERLRQSPCPVSVVALVGPGNNGADALLAALMLGERGWPVAAYSPFGAVNAARFDAQGTLVRTAWHERYGASDDPQTLTRMLQAGTAGALVIDGLFGIGLDRPIQGEAARVLEEIRRSQATVVAVDIPSGLDADRGAVVGGAAGVAARADLTVSLLVDKPGLHTGVAVDHVGTLRLASLGLEGLPSAGMVCAQPDGELIDANWVRARLHIRARDTHKGTWGRVGIMGGAQSMSGAAFLAAAGAQAMGCGKLFIASPDSDAQLFDPGHPHWMTRDWLQASESVEALAVGCGMGTAAKALEGLERALGARCPLVLDADALTLLAQREALRQTLARRSAPTVLTPHPLEAARLAGCDVATLQRDRLGQALALARLTSACVLLKGAGSVVAHPDGAWAVIGSGSPALGTAGAGDVLAGALATLLAQGRGAFEAAALAAWLHGEAGQKAQQRWPRGIGLAGAEIAGLMRDAINEI
jgi:hydroxyethylthiazole kinase-like uncharacterized protein yjeF